MKARNNRKGTMEAKGTKGSKRMATAKSKGKENSKYTNGLSVPQRTIYAEISNRKNDGDFSLTGGRCGGKTFLMSRLAVEYVSTSRANVAVICATSQAVDRTRKAIAGAAKQNGVRLRPATEGTRKTLSANTGYSISFFSEDDIVNASRFKSMLEAENIGLCWIEDAELFKETQALHFLVTSRSSVRIAVTYFVFKDDDTVAALAKRWTIWNIKTYRMTYKDLPPEERTKVAASESKAKKEDRVCARALFQGAPLTANETEKLNVDVASGKKRGCFVEL